MARSATVRSNEAPEGEDTGTKFSTERQRSMAGREQVLEQGILACIATGARFFAVPLSMSYTCIRCDDLDKRITSDRFHQMMIKASH